MFVRRSGGRCSFCMCLFCIACTLFFTGSASYHKHTRSVDHTNKSAHQLAAVTNSQSSGQIFACIPLHRHSFIMMLAIAGAPLNDRVTPRNQTRPCWGRVKADSRHRAVIQILICHIVLRPGLYTTAYICHRLVSVRASVFACARACTSHLC